MEVTPATLGVSFNVPSLRVLSFFDTLTIILITEAITLEENLCNRARRKGAGIIK